MSDHGETDTAASEMQSPARTITVPITVTPLAKRIIVWFLSFTAFVLSCVAVGSCKFVQLTQSTDSGVTVAYFGLFQFLSGGTCVSLDLMIDDNLISLSPSDEAARAFGVLACIFGGVAVLAFLSVFCKKMDQNRWRAIGIALVVCLVFQSFTFLVFNSSRCKSDAFTTACNIDEGGAASVSAMIFYMFAAAGVFLLPVPTGSDIVLDFDGQSSYSPHQTQKTVTEVTNSDGTKTVFVTESTNAFAPPTDKEEGQNEEENKSDDPEEIKKSKESEEDEFDDEASLEEGKSPSKKSVTEEASEKNIDAKASTEDCKSEDV
eukprot:CAMPEP_0185725216 /NCGR_PEP_ID=MMETSP1171-20130828/1520_1 /TAXON_ID=374046 /ORGANISM="Helicotheca tamensis, Strain CCMP826" /LENGTH=318 /DNA_ID=CAMNT_0028393279 /DNA_START=84 /DNA_END=1040 /DNA_ORIENTATION=-